jgi:intraflagellar transport protein 172
MVWPRERHKELFFGLAEGKVKVGTLKNNKSAVSYSTDSYVVALASNREGDTLISGHLDGTIYSYNIES